MHTERFRAICLGVAKKQSTLARRQTSRTMKKYIEWQYCLTGFGVCCFGGGRVILTDSIPETGAYGVPSKSQMPTILGQVPNVHMLAGHAVNNVMRE